MNDFELNKSQKNCMKALRSGKNVCLMGEAGTGKTSVLNRYIDECKEQKKNVIMAAPTGIAALKINGVTLHNACAIPVPAYGYYDFDIVISKVKALLEADVFVIDEISMCRNDVFEYFALVIKKVEAERKKMGKTNKIQIIVSGDFFQLPPIVRAEDLNAFKRLALDASGFCFTTPAWKSFHFKTIILTEVVRQNDLEFIENLNKLRKGDTTCLSYFNKRVLSKEELAENEDVMHICSTNSEVQMINDAALAKIDGPRCIYQAKHGGFCGKDYPTDDNLVLKNNARIMFIANDIVHDDYRNGQIGTIKECKEESIIVTLDTGKEIEVKPYRWATNKIDVVNGMTQKGKEIGWYTQLPIKLAYGITMHKTQGQTYEKAIISPNSFAEGQLYVAISRVKTIEGLMFTDEILPEYVKVSKLVLKFYDGEYEVPETRIKKKKELAAKALKKHNEKKRKKKSTAKKTVRARKSTATKTKKTSTAGTSKAKTSTAKTSKARTSTTKTCKKPATTKRKTIRTKAVKK